MIKYFKCESLEKTGLVKTAYTTNNSEVRWKIFSKDEKKECLKYYEELASIFGIKTSDMIRIPQKHSTNVKVVKKEDGGLGILREEDEGYIDGMITNEKGIMLCTVEADCVPVYILDPVKKVIGMIHSGWRGTVGKISIKALDMMKEKYGTKIENVLIYLGPSICKDCYEVRDDVIDEYKKIFSDEEIREISEIKKDSDINDRKYLIDVKKALKMTLLKYGVKYENIDESSYCTYHNDDLFDSYRRTKDVGHILSCIMLK